MSIRNWSGINMTTTNTCASLSSGTLNMFGQLVMQQLGVNLFSERDCHKDVSIRNWSGIHMSTYVHKKNVCKTQLRNPSHLWPTSYVSVTSEFTFLMGLPQRYGHTILVLNNYVHKKNYTILFSTTLHMFGQLVIQQLGVN